MSSFNNNFFPFNFFFVFTQTAKLLGFDNYIPPYASTNGDQLLTGVNFASAAAGIREETGQQLVFAQFQLYINYKGEQLTEQNW